MNNYLASAKQQFGYYKKLGEKTIDQLAPEMLFFQPNFNSNSIAIIVNHLHGNMLSRWTDFLNSDGEKTWRNRDTEFEDVIKNKEELLTRWQAGWNCLFQALDSLNESNLGSTVYIRNEAHSVAEAINRQLCHYAYHVGQIVYIAKVLVPDKWQSLTIPKGQSESFNQQKFANPKQ